MKAIPEIPFGVYDSYYEPMQAYIKAVAEAAPEYVRVSSICETSEGRQVTLLTMTDFATGAPEDKPALLIFANIHCHELSGPVAALTTVRNLLMNNLDMLSTTTFYIIPRLNPDNTEKVIRQSGFIRSKWDYTHRTNTFHHQDLDGDGVVSNMRMECPWGNMVIDPKDPYHMIPRTADSKGPFYLVFGEGVFEKWDGNPTVENECEGHYRDWNRTSLVGWDRTVTASGDFPYSEPEMYHFMKFVTGHKNIFGFINYHNGWGAVIGPVTVEPADSGFIRELYDYASRLEGYPVYFGNEPCHGRKEAVPPYKACGQFDDTAYGVFGLVPVTLELGTYENSAGYRTEDVFECDFMKEYNPNPKMVKYQDEHPEYPRKAVRPWKPFNHPQLGPVEIGGSDCVGLASPAPGHLAKVCEATYEFTVKFASKKPCMRIADVKKDAVGGDIYRLRILLQNAGELPTYVMEPGKSSAWREKPYAELSCEDGAVCLSRATGVRFPHFKAWETRELEWFIKVTPGSNASVTLAVNGGAAGNVTETIRFS